jgi:catechol 2,3-dioxygenase-like lactoylglutathione lyase family enzyme
MLAKQLHHASFPIRDLERSRRFYGGVLGLEEAPRPDLGFPGAWYRVGDGQIHLLQTPPGVDVGSRPPTLNPMAPHTALAIDDYARVLAALRSHGIEVLETAPEIGQMWVQDPDGNILELIAPPAGR